MFVHAGYMGPATAYLRAARQQMAADEKKLNPLSGGFSILTDHVDIRDWVNSKISIRGVPAFTSSA
jgi:hypothetical protein